MAVKELSDDLPVRSECSGLATISGGVLLHPHLGKIGEWRFPLPDALEESFAGGPSVGIWQSQFRKNIHLISVTLPDEQEGQRREDAGTAAAP